jgi:hypothetical protein
MAYGPPQSAHTTQTGAFVSSAGNTFGGRFVLAAAGDITALRWLRPPETSAAITARTLRLWDDAATPVQLASAATSGESGPGWKDAVLSPAYTVTAGKVVRVSIDNPDNMNLTGSVGASAIINGDISLTTFYRNAPVTGPPITARTTDYFVDLVFRTGTPGPSIPTTGQTWPRSWPAAGVAPTTGQIWPRGNP